MKTGEVTPAGWLPGKPKIKPSPDLAGKAWNVRRKAITDSGLEVPHTLIFLLFLYY